MKKLISIRKPRIRVTSKKISLIAPRMRIGRKIGVNVSRRGVSGSVRTAAGTYNTKRGCTTRLLLLLVLLLCLIK